MQKIRIFVTARRGIGGRDNIPRSPKTQIIWIIPMPNNSIAKFWQLIFCVWCKNLYRFLTRLWFRLTPLLLNKMKNETWCEHASSCVTANYYVHCELQCYESCLPSVALAVVDVPLHSILKHSHLVAIATECNYRPDYARTRTGLIALSAKWYYHTLNHNFAKCCPFIKILSLWISVFNNNPWSRTGQSGNCHARREGCWKQLLTK